MKFLWLEIRWKLDNLDVLVSGFVNILVYLNKQANNLKPLDRSVFFKKIEILQINLRFIWPLSFKIIDNLY